MTEQSLEDMAGDDTPQGSAPGTDEDARVQVLQAVVDRVVSWQEGAEDGTVRAELDDALAGAGVDLDDAAEQRIVERVSGETPHFDVREVL